MANAPSVLTELFGESNAHEAAKKCLLDPWFAALVKVAQEQRESMKYARDQLQTLTETDHYGNAVANAFVELDGALQPMPSAKRIALLTASLKAG